MEGEPGQPAVRPGPQATPWGGGSGWRPRERGRDSVPGPVSRWRHWTMEGRPRVAGSSSPEQGPKRRSLQGAERPGRPSCCGVLVQSPGASWPPGLGKQLLLGLRLSPFQGSFIEQAGGGHRVPLCWPQRATATVSERKGLQGAEPQARRAHVLEVCMELALAPSPPPPRHAHSHPARPCQQEAMAGVAGGALTASGRSASLQEPGVMWTDRQDRPAFI